MLLFYAVGIATAEVLLFVVGSELNRRLSNRVFRYRRFEHLGLLVILFAVLVAGVVASATLLGGR